MTMTHDCPQIRDICTKCKGFFFLPPASSSGTPKGNQDIEIYPECNNLICSVDGFKIHHRALIHRTFGELKSTTVHKHSFIQS